MACWSAENATRAFLKTMNMSKRIKEPDEAEFISALAAGSNAQLMVVACGGAACSTTLSLVAAAHQTGGRVVCILPGVAELRLSRKLLGPDAKCIEFVIGEAQNLLTNEYKGADFVVVDCGLKNHEMILKAMKEGGREKSTVVLGYNAFSKDSWGGSETQLLPIGEGLLLTRVGGKAKVVGGHKKRSHWVVKVDKCTGEEHVFRVRSPPRGVVAA